MKSKDIVGQFEAAGCFLALHEQLLLCGLMGKTSVTTEELGTCHLRPLSQDI